MIIGSIILTIGISGFVFAEFFRRKGDMNIHTIKLYISSVIALCLGSGIIVYELVKKA